MEFQHRSGVEIYFHGVDLKGHSLRPVPLVQQNSIFDGLEGQHGRSSVQDGDLRLALRQFPQINQHLQLSFYRLLHRQTWVQEYRDVHVAQVVGLVPRFRAKQVGNHHVRLPREIGADRLDVRSIGLLAHHAFLSPPS